MIWYIILGLALAGGGLMWAGSRPMNSHVHDERTP